MTPVRFVHCADLHIDSPFRGIADVHPQLGKLLCGATHQAFSNIVDLAIDEQVDCVLVAGDAYDSAHRNLHAQLKFKDGLLRLSDAGIPSFVVHGDRDPLEGRCETLEYPQEVHFFPSDEVACFPLLKNGRPIAQIYGISVPTREACDDLSAGFQVEATEVPSIGLLHASTGTDGAHEPFAPCTVEDLSARGLDYWALGHLHTHAVLEAGSPAIVYPGCPQSTTFAEAGQKGCCLVALGQGGKPDIRFVPTDVVRHSADTVDICDCSTRDDVASSIREKCEEIASGLDKCHAVIRLCLSGRSDLHTELHSRANLDGLLENTREHFEGRDPWIWLERLVLRTQGSHDLETLRQGRHFAADILSIYDELENDKSACWEEIQEKLSALFSDWPGERHLRALSTSELSELAGEARDWTLDRVVRREPNEDM